MTTMQMKFEQQANWTNPTTRQELETALDARRLYAQVPSGRWWLMRRNGVTKTWKCDPNRFQIGYKMGLKIYGQVTDSMLSCPTAYRIADSNDLANTNEFGGRVAATADKDTIELINSHREAVGRPKFETLTPAEAEAHIAKINEFAEYGQDPWSGEVSMPTPSYGRGFDRMKKNLGAENAEALRQQVVADQEAALADAAGRPRVQRDRSQYRDYPAPKKAK